MEQSATPSRLASGLSREFLLLHRICPRSRDADGTLRLATGPSAPPGVLGELRLAFECGVIEEPVGNAELEALIERLTARDGVDLALAPAELDTEALEADVRDLVNEPPVIRYVNLLVRDAFDAGASDIHLEATRHGLVTRFRVDGVLAAAAAPAPPLQHAVVSRIKLLAELDISERRRPQDGRIRVRLEDRELDIRISTVPTVHGESLVLRLLEQGGRPISLFALGLDDSVWKEISSLVLRPHGLFLVTGPTGSGKTTTLYAALQLRDSAREKIVTVEDPIEYRLDGVTQVPVHRQSGVSFATALRAILRQDPDVVMIGEMRDPETAEIAVQAALTGHLVLSTLHTNDALSAIPRLVDLGVPEYLVASTLEGVAAQRLVRRICLECREPYQPEAGMVERLAGGPVGGVVLYHGAGCGACRGTGFRGRVGVFEFLRVTEEMREAIAQRQGTQALHRCARTSGFATLRQDAWAKVRGGVTTVEEVFRVVQD